MIRHRSSKALITLVVIWWLRITALSWTFSTVVLAANNDDYYDEYVQEVLQEDDHGDYGEGYHQEDEYYHQQQQQMESEADRQAREQADRLAREREQKFQAELDKMNEEQQKAALQQKKKDGRIVRSVLKAANRNQLYAVLGLKQWDFLRIPERKLSIGSVTLRIPGLNMAASTKDIRKAYRTRAMAVHPDKNRDGRAQEAFIAVEQAASILSNESLRAEYDNEQRLLRSERRSEAQGAVVRGLSVVQQTVGAFWTAVYTILGPFATPVLILGFLLM